jgi:hypothetical protein
MHNEHSHPGYDLLRDRQDLEDRQPELAGGYQKFLRGFAQFREVQRQFKHLTKKAVSRRSSASAIDTFLPTKFAAHDEITTQGSY